MSFTRRSISFSICLCQILLSASSAIAQPKEFLPIQDDPNLPRVLLIGDSISIGYTLGVRRELDGIANVHRIPTNGGPTTRGLKEIEAWLGDKKWDVIHFNWGLHDLKHIDGQGRLVPVDKGTVQVPVADYEKNLKRLAERLKKTGARVVWATTTPVPEGAGGRVVGDATKYNAVAERVMHRAGVPIDDLFGLVAPRLTELQRPRNVHFTPRGSLELAKQVAFFIRRLLARPNFLVILCDDLGYGDLACFGSQTIRTPYLDRLANQGLKMTSAYSAAPVCSPARAGLLTGRTPSRVGVFDWIPSGHPMHLRKDEVTIATLLSRAGYSTAHFGKWHLNGKFNHADQPQPGDHGFDTWFSTQNNARPSHHGPKNFVRNGKAVGKLEGYSCDIVAGETISWLRDGRDAAKPFFSFVCFHEPHEPVASPGDLVAKYPDAKKRGEALYYANVTNMDRAVGRLMASLDELKLAENTLVMFTSDNGPETLNRYGGAWRSHGSPGPLRGMKLHIYEGGIRVPMILRWPGKTLVGGKSVVPISALDILPSFCDLGCAQLPGDRALDGGNFAPLFRGGTIERDQGLFWHYYNALSKPKVALRIGDWKLVAHLDTQKNRPGGGLRGDDMRSIKEARLTRYELYNLAEDLAETHDRTSEEKERVASMSAQLEKRMKAVLAEAPVWKLPVRK